MELLSDSLSNNLIVTGQKESLKSGIGNGSLDYVSPSDSKVMSPIIEKLIRGVVYVLAT